MVRNVWTVSLRTTLPETGYSEEDMKKTVKVFDSFEKAREEFRKTIRDFAFSDNSMFDGNGRVKLLDDYIQKTKAYEGYDIEEEGVISTKKLLEIHKALTTFFSGEDTELVLKEGDEYCTDWMIAYEYKDGIIRFFGDDDGPCNGYNPTLTTNAFTMNEEKNYYLYIDDRFGQDEDTSELYVDLAEATFDCE